MKLSKRSLTEGPILSGIITYTIPIILTGLLQLLFNAADLVVVGRYRGSIAVAAVSATGAITNLIVNLFIGLSVGAGVGVAHGLGGKQNDEVHRTVHTAIPTAFIGGIILTIIGVVFADDFLLMMNTPWDVLPYATKYMKIYFCGMTFMLLYNFAASILRAAGDTKTPLLFLSIAGVVNVLLNLFFVIKLEMHVEGVALATIISQAVSAILVLIALMCRKDACKLSIKKLRFYKPQLLKIIRIGMPAGLQGSLFSISNVFIMSSFNSFNNSVLISGNGAASNIEGFVYVIMNSLHQTAVNYIGQNVGAGKFDRVKKIYWICMICVAVAGMTAGGLVIGFGEQLLNIYITDSQQAIQYGLTRFSIVCATYFLCGIMDVSTGSLRGLGSSFIPMLISVLGVCGLRILWIYTIFRIPQFHTPESLYWSYPVSWLVTVAAQMTAFMIVYRKKSKQALAEPT